MSKKDNQNDKLPFSISWAKKKNFIKKQLERLKGLQWSKYMLVIIISFVLGISFAIYQFITDQDLSQESAEVEIVELEEEDEYQFEMNEEVSVPLMGEEDPPTETEEEPTEDGVEKEEDSYEKEEEKLEEEKLEEEKAEETVSAQQMIDLIKPTNGEVRNAWDWYQDEVLEAWKFNAGVDIYTALGAEVKAAKAGQVKEIVEDELYGTEVVIKHNQSLKTTYSNLDETVTLGEEVAQGQVIGKVVEDSFYPESRLRFKVIENGENISPLEYIK
ncbi:M23 family metallopeptidase [Natroniella sulfidigena]|uniref:M23 family metallopeptidase n=1 Tax=Natroniella sulfidigena TaxID=723921 RepID=UPI00200A3349|nr:M23 family metallopeptidase [Natroniella sulfidigena]MCK8816386.1 M23 family metallopeptidase [Natroniella sulfidigena]